jgi:hypothetical protein
MKNDFSPIAYIEHDIYHCLTFSRIMITEAEVNFCPPRRRRLIVFGSDVELCRLKHQDFRSWA